MNKMIDAIKRNAATCPDPVDLMDRVANGRILSAGQKRWLDQIMKPGGRPGNQNAAKPDELKRTARLVLTMTPLEKAHCVKQAQRAGGINAWARKMLRLEVVK